MRTKYVEINEPAVPAFAQVKRFTRKRMQPVLSGLSQGASSTGIPLDYEQAAPVRARRIKGLTTFNIVLVLIVFAVLVVVYISNVVAVDGLMTEQIGLEREEQLLLQERETLRAEINMLSSYNRIQAIATEKLGLVHANQQPYSLTVFGMSPNTTK
ncbi:MAG: cell division protein FtsL [Bacteroidota bacterium]